MNLSDEAKLFAVRAKLLEAERTIYEANKIIANIGKGSPPETMEMTEMTTSAENEPGADGLYPGQLPYQKGDGPRPPTSDC
jgi:hypothetical protein